MNRVKDYSNFAICFAGLGYIALWPLSSPDAGGHLFGGPLICRDGAFALVDWLCHCPHPLRLSLPLHALGFFSAMFVMARFSWRTFRRVRRKPMAAAAAPPPAKALRRRQKPLGPPRPVKPRAQFGLRGMPH